MTAQRNAFDAASDVTSLAGLKALTGQDNYIARITEGGRAGTFRFDSSDLSTEVTADTQEGIYVAPDSDATGASGAWVRQYGQTVDSNPEIMAGWFGVVLDGSTDDLVALQAYADYLATIADDPESGDGISQKHQPTFYIPSCAGAVITDTLTIAKNINVVMDGPILVSAAATTYKTWVHIGEPAVVNRQGRGLRMVIDVRRVTLSDWTDYSDIGCKIEGTALSKIWLRRLDRFAVGAEITAPYSIVDLGEFRDNRKGLRVVGSQWDHSNQMQYNAGEFACDSATHPTLGRYGIEVYRTGVNPGVGDAKGNTHTFSGPSFELFDGGSGEAVPFLIEDVDAVVANSVRMEGSGDIVARLTGDCRWCEFKRLFGNEFDYPVRDSIEDNSTYKIGNKVSYESADYDITKAYMVFDSGLLIDRATRFDTGGWHFVDMENLVNTDPGSFRLDVQGTTTPDYHDKTVTLAQYVGVRVRAEDAKTFTAVVDGPDTKDCNIIWVAFDSDGNQLTANTDILRNVQTPTNTVNTGVYGGFVAASADLDNARQHTTFTMSANVATFFVGITGGPVKSFRLYAHSGTATAFSVSTEVNPGARISRITPSDAGHYRQGAVIWDSDPSASNPPGRVCVTTGQFGTLASTTANTTSGSRSLTVNDASGLAIGYAITIAGVTGTKIIQGLEGLNVFVDSNCDATVSGAAVAYVAPVFKDMGNLSA